MNGVAFKCAHIKQSWSRTSHCSAQAHVIVCCHGVSLQLHCILKCDWLDPMFSQRNFKLYTLKINLIAKGSSIHPPRWPVSTKTTTNLPCSSHRTSFSSDFVDDSAFRLLRCTNTTESTMTKKAIHDDLPANTRAHIKKEVTSSPATLLSTSVS